MEMTRVVGADLLFIGAGLLPRNFRGRLCGGGSAGALAIFIQLAFLEQEENKLQSTQADMKSKQITTTSTTQKPTLHPFAGYHVLFVRN